MPLNIEQYDDQLAADSVPSFKGGMVSNERPALIQQDEWALLENVDITRFGRGTTRRGTAALGSGAVTTATVIQGLWNYQTPAVNYLIAINNGKLFQYDGVSAWTQIGTFAGNSSNQFAFAQGIDKFYWSDASGTAHLTSWDGTTVVDEGATTTNLDPPRGITQMEWFTGRLCATTGNDTLYFSNFLAAGAGQWNAVTQSFRVGEGEGDPIKSLKGWLDFNLLVGKQHSIYVVNCNPANVGTGDVDLMVANYNIQPVHKKIGTMSPLTWQQVGSDVFFLSSESPPCVRSIKRTEAGEYQSEVSEALSFGIQDYMARINLAALPTACATFYNNRYFLAVPLDSATTPNFVFVYDAILSQLRQQAVWSGYWSNWLPTVFAKRVPASNPSRMVFGQSDGTVSEWLDYVTIANEGTSAYQDRGVTEIRTTKLSRALTLQDLVSPKTGYEYVIEFDQSSAGVVLSYIIDGSTSVFNMGQFKTALADPLTLPFRIPATLSPTGVKPIKDGLMALNQWKELQFQLQSLKGKLASRSIAITAFVDSYTSQDPKDFPQSLAGII